MPTRRVPGPANNRPKHFFNFFLRQSKCVFAYANASGTRTPVVGNRRKEAENSRNTSKNPITNRNSYQYYDFFF